MILNKDVQLSSNLRNKEINNSIPFHLYNIFDILKYIYAKYNSIMEYEKRIPIYQRGIPNEAHRTPDNIPDRREI